ncbi:DM13 domain-containing protein [Rathayibacter sp. VKM Ac-2760]|uniref:DM13 domain-containing protein n=1 Tax=Rathayibacter sp. VKM Ac-2760 TaxID=2609253 RepID=UPI001316C8F4|nr:DM13 domain-containing protein [Rathayibacter sp. VKM Ac-2760]QHC57164.1 hypothetical protein GSU72_00175 [Rathayibacter sp. VKM Ac-2760]
MSRYLLPKAVAGVVLIAGVLTGCAPSITTTQSSDSTSSSTPAGAAAPSTLAPAGASLAGTFEGLNGKKVSGTATLEGATLDLSGFASDEGPDLHLYLTNGTDEKAVSAGVELGAVAYDSAKQTFTVDDAAGYSYVVVHCDKAKAVFGAAKLS